MKLEVGKKYRRRDGEIVVIIDKSVGDGYPFYSDSGDYYTEGGNYWAESGNLDSTDLIEEYIEPQKDQGEKTFNICIDFYDGRVWSIDFCELIADINGRIHAYRLKDVKSFTISEK